MNKTNRRSSLRKAPNNEEDTTSTTMRIKRRISFSGKKSVREFVNTEEPKNWDHSYEVSDHLSAEDSSGAGSGSAAGAQALNGEDKENNSVPASSVCERTHIDITLNLQTSVDVTLLPCELSTKKQKQMDQVRDSLFLTLEERQGLQDTLYDRRIMDKTLDVMSGSLVARLQNSVHHNASDAEQASIGKRENSIHNAANCMSDSFMDITPLSHTPAAPAPAAPASAAPASQHPVDIELDMFNDHQNLLANEKENICPAQKSLFMELEEEEEAVKPVKNKTQHEAVDISFASSLNVFADKDLLPPTNISFESVSSANSTINFKDDSVLVPLDMISGKRISKKINLRQLNDELESGKIQLFPNGPKTPTTDRKAKMKRYWHALGVEEMDNEEECPAQDIKSSIKPRGMLFSESMVMSPAPAPPPPMAPTQKDIRNKAKDKDKDDKRKYRFSQADEIMLDNTNFLAHARLGDETQSRNTSKNSTRRETTYDYSELDLERPASRQDSHHPMPSFRPRQSIHHPEAMEADQSVSFSAIPSVKNTAPPPRRTVHQPVEMEADQSVSFSTIPAAKTTAPAPPQDQEDMDLRRAKEAREKDTLPAYTRIKTKRRETLLLQVSMEEEIINPPMELHPAPVEKTNSKPRHTLHLAKNADKENLANPSQELPLSKSRQSVMLDEPMEEEIELSIKNQPDDRQMATESKQTLDMEEEEIHTNSKEPFTLCPSHKSRRTIIMSEAIEEDTSIIQPREPSLLKYKTFEAPYRPKTRHTLLMAEPIEEDRLATFKSSIPTREQTRSKPRNTILMAEPMLEDSVCNVVEKEINLSTRHQPDEIQTGTKARQTLDMEEEEIQLHSKEPLTLYPLHKSRKTIIMSEAIEEDKSIIQPSEPSLLKYKTFEAPHPIEKDQLNAVKSSMPTREQTRSKPRNTILMAEPMLEDSVCNVVPEEIDFSIKHPPDDIQGIIRTRQTLDREEEEIQPNSKEPLTLYPSHKSRKTIIMSEAIEEDKSIIEPSEPSLLKYKTLEKPQWPKARHTLLMAEPIEEERPTFKSSIPTREQARLKPRNTILMAEPMLEDSICSSAERQPKSESMHQTLGRSEKASSKPEEIEQEMDLKSPASNEFLNQQSASLKSRKTIIKAEPIEEDQIVPRSGEQTLVKRYLEEPIEEEVSSNEKGVPSVNQFSKSRKTIIKSEPIEEEPSLTKHNPTEKSSVSYRRQTFVKAEPIEEDDHLPSQEEHPRPKSRNTILITEEIIEDLDLKSVNKPVSLDYQSPQETMPRPDLQVITPMPHPRLTSIYRDLGNFTPGMSLTEFEDQEEMCKTPLPKPKQKQRSVYHPTKMDTSAFGTPVNAANHKRLPKHLTPNLPESKKRHTQLFADSQMEIEVDMEDEAGEEANMALEGEPHTHKFLRGFKIDPFDETVQPVRDYHPALSQLGQVSSLDDVLQVPQPSELEEKPITISDVTNYFQKEKQEEERRSSNRESGSSSDRTFKSYAVAHTKFINLSGDTTIFAGAIDVDEPEEEEEQDELENQSQIGNEQISLVSTLAEETVENEQEPEEPDQQQPEHCQAQVAPLVIAGSTASCRKCGNCNRSLSESRRSTDSFVLPQISLFDFTKDCQRLRRQRQKLSFEEMQKHWQVKSQETEMNESLDETKVEERLFHWDKAKLMQKIKRPKLRRNRDTAPAKSRESFFDRLDRLLADQQPNWIFDFQLKASRQLIFYHRLLTTFRIVVNYKVLDEQDESAIRVCSIAEEKTVAGCPPERWTTFEHYLNFQLSLKMPPNLSDALGGSDEESFLKFLQRIDQIIVGIKRTFHKLMTVLKATNARLLRQSNRIFVRKTLVKCIENEPLVRFERINFVVQIANVEEICFTDILQPELYLFNENLQFLPKGIAFLEAFLPNPEQYLKTST